MINRSVVIMCLVGAFVVGLASLPAPACCPAGRSGKPVVNADQTVIIIWDAATKTQHFVRKATFKSAGDDFGFLVPSPTQPQLEESGNEAFPYLLKLTEPERQKARRPSGGMGCGCAGGEKGDKSKGEALRVTVLEQKEVAGFKAAVLEAESANALVGWLKENGYAFSPEIEAWAKPYVEANWKITALKVAKDTNNKEKTDVAASALRISFKTDRPLFPYREPDSRSMAKSLEASHRLLRLYFLSDARYQGSLTKEHPWTGKVAWTNKLKAEDRAKVLDLLKLPETTGPSEWWLTEFEDPWPYQVAPADVYFARDSNQNPVQREPIIEYVGSPWPDDAMVYVIAVAVLVPPLMWRIRRKFRPVTSR